jgi:6-phosphogluconate dehydrogenase
LAVMGENLALNVESRGNRVAVYNRTTSKVDEFIQGRAAGKNFVGCHSVEELVQSLARPRKVMMLVKAGPAVDALIDSLIPLLEPGDVIIDGGNTHYADTERRTKYVEEQGLLFLGTGVSGGEEGALKGPSLMPGGSDAAWPLLKDIFQSIAAKVGPQNDIPCCEWVGPRGAGHYVKMVHNGIEYGDMQLICEAYLMLKEAVGLSNDEIYDVFAEWNRGELQSYLIEITRDIFSVQDDLGDGYLVDKILDMAGAKGTGKWMSQLALDLGVPSTLVTTAVYARSLSSQKEARVRASEVLQGPDVNADDVTASVGDKQAFIEKVRLALYASKICSYAQGAFDEDAQLENLLLHPYFRDAVHNAQAAWRDVVVVATQLGLPAIAFSNALAYYDSYRRAFLPANLLQAQRDYFGAHTYKRTDREGTFHTEWLDLRKPPVD